MKKYEAKLLIEDRLLLGEGPVYDGRTNKLSFLDIVNGTLFLVDGALAEDTDRVLKLEADACGKVKMDQMVGAAVPMKAAGTYLLAATDGLYTTDLKKVKLFRATDDIYEPCQRSNDAKSDPMGRLYVGSHVFVDEVERHGNLLCIEGKDARILEPNTIIANGMAWSKDRTKFYFADSRTLSIFVYDYDVNTGDISNRTKLCEIEDGMPDGFCIDNDDNLWVAIWNGSRVEKRNGKTGEVMEIIEVPAYHVTSCCFFGRDMNLLLITSSGEGLEGETDGCTFVCKVDATGPSADYLNI